MGNKSFPVGFTCPVCGSSADQINRSYSMSSNLDGNMRHNYWLYRCSQCGMGITYPQPNGNKLSNYYRTSIYKKSDGLISSFAEWFLDYLQIWRLHEIESLCSPMGGKLLDVGCGKGRFVAHAALHGWDAQGADPSSAQAAAARNQYHVQVFKGDLPAMNSTDSSFRVLTAWHSLEHMSDPHVFMDEVHRILEPKGLFVLEVPNVDSWQSKISQGRWFQLDAPWHLGHYSIKAIHHLLAEHGFSSIRLETFSWLEPFAMLQSILNCTGLAPNWLYNWFKYPRFEKQIIPLFLNVLGAALLSAPAAALELLSSLTNQYGGVIRVFATKK